MYLHVNHKCLHKECRKSQPEIQKIQNKYKDKTDERSKMQMAQEMQNLYQKYDIHPFGSMLITFIQLPIMMGMYYATMRSVKCCKWKLYGYFFSGHTT